jgi:hypothetical protein
MHFFYRVALLAAFSLIIGTAFFSPATVRAQQPQQQRVVENVDIQGNRRLRKDDVLYYVQTRAGDTYSEAQVARDLQTILSLGLFDKVGTRVYTEEAPRGGLNVIFEVHELPKAARSPFLQALPADRVAGGRIYDAHIGEVARLAGARWVVTENRRHFAGLLRYGVRVVNARELLAAHHQ